VQNTIGIIAIETLKRDGSSVVVDDANPVNPENVPNRQGAILTP
jgi:hypothetical protein